MIKKLFLLSLLFLIFGCTKIEQPTLPNENSDNQEKVEFIAPEFQVVNLQATNKNINFEFNINTDLSKVGKVRVAVKKHDKNSFKYNQEVSLQNGVNFVEINDLDPYKYNIFVFYLDPNTGLENKLFESSISVIENDYDDFDNPDENIYLSLNQEKIIHEAYFEYFQAYSQIICNMKNEILAKGENDTFKVNGGYVVSPDAIKFNEEYLSIIRYLVVKKIEIEPFLENIAAELNKLFYYTESENEKNGTLYEFVVPKLNEYFESQLTWEERNVYRSLNSKVLFENFPTFETPLIEMKLYYPSGGLIRLEDGEYEYDNKLSSAYYADFGEDVYAPISGIVTSKNDYSVVITNEDLGKVTISNLTDISVSKNEEIEVNEQIGKVGYLITSEFDNNPLLTLYYTKGRYTMNYDFYRDYGKKYSLELGKESVKDNTVTITTDLYSEINYSTMAILYKDGIEVENRFIGSGVNINEFHNLTKGSTYTLKFGYINNYEFDDKFTLIEELEFRG